MVDILHWVENESRKTVPSGVDVSKYHVALANHIDVVLGQGRLYDVTK